MGALLILAGMVVWSSSLTLMASGLALTIIAWYRGATASLLGLAVAATGIVVVADRLGVEYLALFFMIAGFVAYENARGLRRRSDSSGGTLVGWLYRTGTNALVVQVNGAMSRADRSTVRLDVGSPSSRIVSSLRRIYGFPWTGIRVLPCAGSEHELGA